MASARTVVNKVLLPYVMAGRFNGKRLYKEMADLLIKCLYEVDSVKHENTRTRAKKATKRAVYNFFARVNKVTRSADLKKPSLAKLAKLKQPNHYY